MQLALKETRSVYLVYLNWSLMVRPAGVSLRQVFLAFSVCFFLFSLGMEDKVGDLLTGPDIESVQIVQNSARETSQVSSWPDSTIVDLLKTIQEQPIVSNKLLSGLEDNDQCPHSRKRQMSLSDSDDANM